MDSGSVDSATADTGVAPVLPANTTDCTLNAGCLESSRTSTAACAIELTAPIVGSAVDVRVDGTLNAGQRASISVKGFAVLVTGPGGSAWFGYSSTIGRTGFNPGMTENAVSSLHNTDSVSLASEAWPLPNPSSDYAVSTQTSFDSAATSASATTTADGAPTTALTTTGMLAPMSDKLVITVTGGEVCNIVVTAG